MTTTEIIDVVAQACRILGQLELTQAALGHVSYRLGDSETMLIKGKGPAEVGLRYTRPDDILVVDSPRSWAPKRWRSCAGTE